VRTVAALFVDPKGPYPRMPGVDAWDEARDARLYAGPHPVVAHPPCQLWVNMARVNFKRYGGEHNRPGNDGGCFASALSSVRLWGGVLEHPAGSHAWKLFGLCPILASDGPGWILAIALNGSQQWVCEVWQSAYGHKARKRTWLLYCGSQPPFELRWERAPGTHQIGWFDRIKPTLSKKEASRTPQAFADELVRLARHSVAAEAAE
jgi:hypothetical protein